VSLNKVTPDQYISNNTTTNFSVSDDELISDGVFSKEEFESMPNAPQ